MDENGDFGLNNQISVRENLRASKKEFNKTEDDLKSLQSVGQIIGEVLRPLDNERCNDSTILLFLILNSLFSVLAAWLTSIMYYIYKIY